MKIQILADDNKLLGTIEDVQNYLMSHSGTGKLVDDIQVIYKEKYMQYMYEKYKMDRREGTDRRHL